MKADNSIDNATDRNTFNSAITIIKRNGNCANILCSMCDICKKTTNKTLSGNTPRDIKQMAIEYIINFYGETKAKEILVEALI